MTNMPGGLIEVKVVPGGLPQNWQRIKGIGDDAVRTTVYGSSCCHKPPFLKI